VFDENYNVLTLCMFAAFRPDLFAGCGNQFPAVRQRFDLPCTARLLAAYTLEPLCATNEPYSDVVKEPPTCLQIGLRLQCFAKFKESRSTGALSLRSFRKELQKILVLIVASVYFFLEPIPCYRHIFITYGIPFVQRNS
jgi:hypothetical protein